MDEQYRNMLYELSLQEAIQQQLDELVRLATQTVVNHINLKEMENSQLRNLINVAATVKSVEVVTNFIRYQIGRNAKAWRGETDFGHEVIKAIEGPIKELADSAVDATQAYLKQKGVSEEDLQKSDVDQKKKLTHQQLTEFYLGYLNRCFYYAKKTSDKDKPSTGLDEMRAALEATNAK